MTAADAMVLWACAIGVAFIVVGAWQLQAQRLGMKLHADGRGLQRGDEMIAVENEEDIYRWLQLPFVPPERRD